MRQQYLLLNEAAAALVNDSDLDEADRRKAAFATQTLLDALAPTNFAATNPAVLKRAIETNGQSLARGMQTYLDDLANNGGARGRSPAASTRWVATSRSPPARSFSATT